MPQRHRRLERRRSFAGRLLLFAAILSGASIFAPPCLAGLIITDMPLANPSPSTHFGLGLGYLPYDPMKAQGFTMGALDYSLTSVSVTLSFPHEADGRVVSFDLYSDDSGIPGSLLSNVGTLSVDGAVVNATDYMLNPTGIILQAHTTYWLVASANRYWEDQTWFGGSPQTIPAGPGATYFGSMSLSNTVDPVGWVPSSYYNSYTLNGGPLGSAVPEPGSIVLLAAGMSLFWLRRRLN